MNSTLRIILLVALLIYYTVIIFLLKRKSLTLKYTLLWLVAGFVMFISVIFPQLLEKIIQLLGIVELTNGLFAIFLFFILIIMVSITSIVSKLNDKNRQMAQQCAMYEQRIRRLEHDSVKRKTNEKN